MKLIAENLLYTALIIGFLWTLAAYGQDRAVYFDLKFPKGATSTVAARKIVRGTSHTYKFRARAGQQISALIKTGNKTSLSVYSLNSGVLENADGVKSFADTLPDSGEYYIVVGTDATALYRLSVTIK